VKDARAGARARRAGKQHGKTLRKILYIHLAGGLDEIFTLTGLSSRSLQSPFAKRMSLIQGIAANSRHDRRKSDGTIQAGILSARSDQFARDGGLIRFLVGVVWLGLESSASGKWRRCFLLVLGRQRRLRIKGIRRRLLGLKRGHARA
jgi:hypothetical protein